MYHQLATYTDPVRPFEVRYLKCFTSSVTFHDWGWGGFKPRPPGS